MATISGRASGRQAGGVRLLRQGRGADRHGEAQGRTSPHWRDRRHDLKEIIRMIEKQK